MASIFDRIRDPDYQQNLDLYNQGKATRVITGYRTQRIGPSGSKRVPIYAYIPKQQQAAPAPAPAPRPTPTPPKPIVPQISAASKKYRADTEKLLKQITGEREKFATDQKVAEQARIQRENIARETAITSASNLARAGKSPELQIRPTESAGADAAGTNRFKRRRQQFKIRKPSYSGLSISKGKMVNI